MIELAAARFPPPPKIAQAPSVDGRYISTPCVPSSPALPSRRRNRRGWPFFEDSVATLLKPSPPRGSYELPAWPFVRSEYTWSDPNVGPTEAPPLICSLWAKVVRVTRKNGGPIFQCKPLARTHKPLLMHPRAEGGTHSYGESDGGGHGGRGGYHDSDLSTAAAASGVRPELLVGRHERARLAKQRLMEELRGKEEAERERQASIRKGAAALVKSSRTKPAPLSPSAFVAMLRQKAFADGTDCAPIAGLYRAVLEDGFGGLAQLRLCECGWDDADVRTLARTLR